jgi:hypothetical protein
MLVLVDVDAVMPVVALFVDAVTEVPPALVEIVFPLSLGRTAEIE